MAEQDMIVWYSRWEALDEQIDQFRDSLLKMTPEKAQLEEAQAAAKEKLEAAQKATKEELEEAQKAAKKDLEAARVAVKEKLEAARAAASKEEQIEILNFLTEILNLSYLVDCLKQFAHDQFDFFYDGFVTHTAYKLNWSREFPPEYVFSVTLYQIAEDLEVIRRAASQRLVANTGAQLREADKLTWNALKPMINVGILSLYENGSPPTVMTYFQKSASIRIIPYAPVALIGIPFTAPSVRRDYLAIPHEVGHYVYRHGRVKGGQPIPQVLGRRLLELPEPSPKYVQRWKEEIFADVYGCLVGGPVVALSFRDLTLQSSRVALVQTPGEYLYGQLTEDDGVHPTAVLRPYVYTKILSRMSVGLAQKFEDGWTEKINEITEFAPPLNEELKLEVKAVENNVAAQIRESTQFSSAPNDENAKREVEEAARKERIRKGTKFRSRYTGASAATYINVEEAKREVEIVIDAVIKLLPSPESEVWSRWSDDPLTELVEKLNNTSETSGISKLSKEVDLGSPASLPSLQSLERSLYSNFENGTPEALREVEDDPPSLQLPNSLEDLWKNWVKRENFFPGFPEPPTKDKATIDPGKAEKLEVLEREPRYTWNHVFLAGGWATKGPGTGGTNGLLFPKNWRGQTDGGGGTY